MRRLLSLIVAGFVLSSVALAEVRGSYLETRSADVYTGQCFANGEVNLTGTEALMAWKVDAGSWDGVRLDGLSVVAAVKAENTLGDYYHEKNPAKALLLVDDRATAAQEKALVSLAKHFARGLASNVVAVERHPIVMEVPEDLHNKAGRKTVLARMQAGNVAEIRTRLLNGKDHICGNEETFYPPLSNVDHAMPVVAMTDSFQGKGLGINWQLHDKRSAFVGHFTTDVEQAHAQHGSK